MTHLLAIDTTAPTCRVALVYNGESFTRESTEARKAAQQVLPMIEELLTSAGTRLQQLDVLAVASGPGSFTGLRIGVATAQGLSLACSLPVVPLSSLALMAKAASRQHPGDTYLVCTKARDNEIYFAVYCNEPDGDVTLIGREQVVTPEAAEIAPQATGKEVTWTGVGNGWVHREQLETALDVKLNHCLDTAGFNLQDLCDLACIRFKKGIFVTEEQVLPNYVKDKLDYSQ